MPLWHRLIVVGVVLLITLLVARLIDRAIARRQLTPEATTRYRIVRRSITAGVIFVGLLSALLVIPQVRAVAGGLLDFPSRRGDELVLLCWKLGEGEIEYWHGMDEGFAGRKPL